MFSLSTELTTSLTIIITLGLILMFVLELLRSDQAVMLAVALLLFFGILAPHQVLSVLNNSAPVTIACLFVVSAALERTGCIQLLASYLGRLAGRKEYGLLITLCLTALLISPFINNTPVVIVLIPVAISLANQRDIKPSKLLIPLSYASIFGGLITMIGTSTNLLVDGMARQYGLEPFSMFEISMPAIIMAVIGLGIMVLLAPKLLPDRDTLSQQVTGQERHFVSELLVSPGSKLEKRSLEDAHLANGDVLVSMILRGDHVIHHPKNEEILQAGDRLVLNSKGQQLLSISQNQQLGLGQNSDADHTRMENAQVMEFLVSKQSRYQHRPMRDLDLAARYGVHVLAVHRQSDNISAALDDFQLEFGDVILVEGLQNGLDRFRDNGDLITINTGAQQPTQFKPVRASIAMATIITIMILAAFRVMPIEGLAIIGAATVLITGCLTSDQAYQSIDWPILILIYGMLAISLALEQTGVLQLLADHLILLGENSHPLMLLFLVLVSTSIATEFLSNNAVAVLFTPLIILVAQQLGFDPRPFVVAVMFAASASFITPIGYQTNTLVYNAGSYRFLDFLPLGIIMNLLVWISGTALIPLFWPLVIS